MNSKHPQYNRWLGMLYRCYNVKYPGFNHYGGKGVKVCEFLKSNPESITVTIGIQPNGKSIDRINNDGNYSCGRCSECLKKKWRLNIQWATPKQQTSNRSIAIRVEIDGVIKPLSEWADIFGIEYHTARRRIQLGVTGNTIFSRKRLPRFSTPDGQSKRRHK